MIKLYRFTGLGSNRWVSDSKVYYLNFAGQHLGHHYGYMGGFHALLNNGYRFKGFKN